MKALIKFVTMDQIIDVPDWAMESRVCRVPMPHAPGHSTNVHYIGDWRNRVPVFFEETLLRREEPKP